MTHRTVHIDGSGALVSMNLDAWQARGDACAYCPQGVNSGQALSRFGKVVNGEEVKACREHRGSTP